jgi:hypothetical protein
LAQLDRQSASFVNFPGHQWSNSPALNFIKSRCYFFCGSFTVTLYNACGNNQWFSGKTMGFGQRAILSTDYRIELSLKKFLTDCQFERMCSFSHISRNTFGILQRDGIIEFCHHSVSSEMDEKIASSAARVYNRKNIHSPTGSDIDTLTTMIGISVSIGKTFNSSRSVGTAGRRRLDCPADRELKYRDNCDCSPCADCSPPQSDTERDFRLSLLRQWHSHF